MRMAAAAGVATLGLSLCTAPASAETPEFRQIVGVGSDTAQDVLIGLGEVIPAPNNTPDNQLIASCDATGASVVKSRAVGCVIPRPNGSSAGVDALWNAIPTAQAASTPPAPPGARPTPPRPG
ncbi:hypothetical protein [Streptomyces odonnellii]|uniref:hypothetical protein n=1 Tax=Streptomyces odonnellii TaxID=1417980 RepID=UPI0012FED24E|nr:hypothetical protein [Streptomyces odonnellii]